MLRRSLFIVCVFISILSCNNKNQKEEDEINLVRAEQKKEEIIVKVTPVKRDRFNLELVSNGKVEATRKATVNFVVNDVVTAVYVKNGDRVRKGDPLVAVDDRKARLAVENAKVSMDQALLNVKMDIIGDGMVFKTMDDTINLPPERRKIIFLQRGYTSARKAFENAIYDYTHVVAKAPFSGVVADFEAKEYNNASNYKSVCTLIDDSQMEVIFSVLETEIKNLRTGMEVEITPYADYQHTLTGKISQINPRIDENGMVKIKAVTQNKDALLVDGMNVSILIKRQIEDKLIIPKSAVLPRQGKKVVFVYKDGKAIWRYVTTGYENSTEISIETGIKERDTVIYDNNLGLSHLSEVTVKEQ